MTSHPHTADKPAEFAEPTLSTAPTRASSKTLLFLGEFLRSPFQIGALHESPPRVAKAMTAELGIPKAQAIVEFGPGTGPLTREIIGNMPRGCKFFAVEKNPRLAKVFRQKLPQVKLYEDTVENIRELCAREQMPKLDVVVSTIPWILLPNDLLDRVFSATVSCMRPGARFSMITYRSEKMKMVQRMLSVVSKHFTTMEAPVRVRSRFSFCYVYRATV